MKDFAPPSTVLRIRVEAVRGSAPRDAGTEMVVWSDPNGVALPGNLRVGMHGTIGGGRLELEAIRFALLCQKNGQKTGRRTFPLGPELGQCCGGAVTITVDVSDHAPHSCQLECDAPTTIPILPGQCAPTEVWIWGAGHVGRALNSALATLPGMNVTWVDVSADRFPANTANARVLTAEKPEHLVRHAPIDAHHIVLTYSHDFDFALCHALLSHGFASAGVIGSATKWARFRSRLTNLGHTDAQILSIACPIGDPTLGKHPTAIAVGVAQALLRLSGAQDPDHRNSKLERAG
ncbi:xanthine dehydrogenase accessory protein XdhC [Aestuariibius sp. HNIBRBA575]|uniref:xanthine dehydrogenase accessory protein XdhC n=1 Tax=Aestuariibius sp. HNIBRBA575 TaxID=3233343 RepID=UPI0034A34AA0